MWNLGVTCDIRTLDYASTVWWNVELTQRIPSLTSPTSYHSDEFYTPKVVANKTTYDGRIYEDIGLVDKSIQIHCRLERNLPFLFSARSIKLYIVF